MMVIPVGPAFNRLEKEHPEMTLIMPDATHPTAVGSYLMAATMYASIYKRDPTEGVAFEGGCEKPLPEAVRRVLTATAWQTAQEWFGWK